MSKKTTKTAAVAAPREGSICARIWAIADSLRKAGKHGRGEVLKECAKRKINKATASTQYGRWRVANGVTPG